MDKKDKLMLMFSFLFLIFVILIFINAVKVEEEEFREVTTHRKSVTFILGEDESSENTFYTNAEAYFKYNPTGRTDEVVTSVRSFNGLIEYLNTSNNPYGEVHIVVHSNPWSGISLPLKDGEERITSDLLSEAISKQEIEALKPHLVDSLTNFHIHACGLGNNQELVGELARVLNNSSLYTSDAYVNFKEENGLYRKSEMQVYYAFYPTAYKPADLHLARQYSKRYPEIDKNWLDAIQHSSYKYNIPVEWEITYSEYDVPTLDTELDKLTWLMNQDELLEIIDKTEIPFDYFRWIVKRSEDGIKVYGKVTVLCVLEEMKA
jgi:hypothetical protein